jgi:hypothetical protein
LLDQCAASTPGIATFTRVITVAEGVYAPGHLGELTQQVPFDLVDAVLTETGTLQKRLRMLPSRVGVYFVLALGLYAHLGYTRVWDKLTAAFRSVPGAVVPCPSDKALRDLRRRLGTAPIKALFDVLAGPLATPDTPGARYRHWRTVAFDGCSSIKAPDTNSGWLGKIKHRMGWAGYPMVQVMCLVETGTRGLLAARFGPTSTGETAYARQLVGALNASMLVLADRGFDANTFFQAVHETKAQFLVRAKSTRRPPVLAVLSDGSWLTRIAGINLRVIDAAITVVGADGSQANGSYRLVTTLTDHRADPAEALIRLYHERWEIESAYFALRHTLLGARVLRSGDRAGLEQELWGLLVTYQLLRRAMTEAAQASGIDPDRLSFTIALETARDALTSATGVLPDEHHTRPDLLGAIGRALTADPLPARRARYSARKVKSPISRYHARPANDDRPLTVTDITTVTTVIHAPALTAPPQTQAGRSPRVPRPRSGPRTPQLPASESVRPTPQVITGKQSSPPARAAVFDLMRSEPHRSWPGRDLARALGETNINSFCTRLSQWAQQGLIHKIARATYTLTTTPLTTAVVP